MAKLKTSNRLVCSEFSSIFSSESHARCLSDPFGQLVGVHLSVFGESKSIHHGFHCVYTQDMKRQVRRWIMSRNACISNPDARGGRWTYRNYIIAEQRVFIHPHRSRRKSRRINSASHVSGTSRLDDDMKVLVWEKISSRNIEPSTRIELRPEPDGQSSNKGNTGMRQEIKQKRKQKGEYQVPESAILKELLICLIHSVRIIPSIRNASTVPIVQRKSAKVQNQSLTKQCFGIRQ